MRKHNYVVGYRGEGQCAYGKKQDDGYDWIDLMTLNQAQKRTKILVFRSGRKINKSVIYKLVEVKAEDSNGK